MIFQIYGVITSKNKTPETVEEIITPGAAAIHQRSPSSDHLNSLAAINSNLSPQTNLGPGMMYNQSAQLMRQQYPQHQFSQSQHQQHYLNQQQQYMLMQQQQQQMYFQQQQQQQRPEQMRQRGMSAPGQLPTLQRAPGKRTPAPPGKH